MKLGISISIAVILIHFGMGAPTENIEDDNDDDYDDYEYPDSSCGDYPEDDVVNGTSTGKYLFFEFLKVAASSRFTKFKIWCTG